MNLLKKIKIKLKSVATDFGIKTSLKFNSPFLTAVALAIAASSVNRAGKYHVLCLGRSIFTNDVEALAYFGTNIRYKVLNLHYWHMIYDHFIPADERKKISESNYHNQPYGQIGKKRYNLYLTAMLPILKKIIGIDAVLAGNFGYVAQQEIAAVCEHKLNIPYIVLHKEGLTIPGTYARKVKLYQDYKFVGSKLLLYNEDIQKNLINANISGINPDKTIVVGIPRFDYYFADKNNKKNKLKQIAFFSFYPKDKFKFLIKDKHKRKIAETRCDNFHKWIINFAKKNPDYKIIIKTKAAGYYLKYAQNVYQQNSSNSIKNIIITNSADPFKLITDSIIITGFNSTTLIEGIINYKTVISPYFGDLITDRYWDYFPHYPQLINYAKSESELFEIMLKYNQHISNDSKAKKEFLYSQIFTPDGQASLRVEKEIIKTIINQK